MANVIDKIAQIRNAILGKDVRESLASGIEAINTETESTTNRQTTLETQFQEQIQNMTLQDPSSAELVAARTKEDATTYPTVGERLNGIDSSLAESENQIGFLDQLKLKFVYNVVGDGITDDTDAIQNAINNIEEGTIFFPATKNFYKVTKAIVAKSNIKFLGDPSKPLIKNTSTDEVNIFNIIGVNNITIESLSIQNATSQIGDHLGRNKNGIYISDSNNINILNCYLSEIGGMSGVYAVRTKGLYISGSSFYKMTYCGLLLEQETEDIFIDKCIFDTVTSTTTPQTYLLATGVEDFSEIYPSRTKNLHITKSKFLNNPRWEGIDTHGCVGFYCSDNYIENVAVGIMCGFDNRPNTPFGHSDIYILNNIIVKGSSTNPGDGILVQGNDNGIGELAENIIISGNKIIGEFGNKNSDYASGIRINNLRNFKIYKNNLNGCVNKVFSMSNCIYGDVSENDFIDTKADKNNLIYACRIWGGCYIVNIHNNTIKNILELTIKRAFYNTNRGLVFFNDNYIESDKDYHVQCALMSGSVTSAKIGKKGVYAKDDYGILKHWCTDDKIRSISATTPLMVTGSTGSNVLTSSANMLTYLAPGEEIIIPGANADGSPLRTVVADYINYNSFTIKDNLNKNIENVAVSTVESTWVNS